MDTGATALTDWRAQLAATTGDAYLKAILRRTPAGRDLYHVWALIGMEPPAWAEQDWQYEQLAFVARVVPAADLAGLGAAEGGVIALGSLSVSVPEAIGPASWARRPSFARHDQLPLPWPVTDYRIAAADVGSRQLRLSHNS